MTILLSTTPGEENVEVFHSAFTPLEWQLNSERPRNACYVKVIVLIVNFDIIRPSYR